MKSTAEEYSFDLVALEQGLVFGELLAETDFYALSDVTMSAEMATYREDLRDLPASTAKSEDVVWPTKP